MHMVYVCVKTLYTLTLVSNSPGSDRGRGRGVSSSTRDEAHVMSRERRTWLLNLRHVVEELAY